MSQLKEPDQLYGVMYQYL